MLTCSCYPDCVDDNTFAKLQQRLPKDATPVEPITLVSSLNYTQTIDTHAMQPTTPPQSVSIPRIEEEEDQLDGFPAAGGNALPPQIVCLGHQSSLKRGSASEMRLVDHVFSVHDSSGPVNVMVKDADSGDTLSEYYKAECDADGPKTVTLAIVAVSRAGLFDMSLCPFEISEFSVWWPQPYFISSSQCASKTSHPRLLVYNQAHL
eukprot:Lankesteria_metandrocarpae@DN1459_c0_g1_i1.p1